MGKVQGTKASLSDESQESFVWRMLPHFVLLITTLMAVYGQYDLYHRGSTPEKFVTLSDFPPVNPLYTMSSLQQKTPLSVKVGDQTFNNLFVETAILSNSGAAPIVPTDFIEPLSVNVSPPWTIVDVVNLSIETVHLKWKRISDQRFEADPFLFNPGDGVVSYIYITNSSGTPQPASDDSAPPKARWETRIINLRAISPRTDDPVSRIQASNWGITVSLGGWKLLFVLCLWLVFFSLYVYQLNKLRLLWPLTWLSVGSLLLSSLISLCASDSISDYIFTSIDNLFGVNNRLNVPIVVANIAALLTLSHLKRRRTSGCESDRKKAPVHSHS